MARSRPYGKTESLFVLKAAPPAPVKGRPPWVRCFHRLPRRDPKSAERFSAKRSQFQRRWYVPHRPQKTGNLATVMGAVINNMQHNLPDRGYKCIALCTFVGNISVNGVFGQQGAPLLPPLEQRWPVTPKHRQVHVLLRNDEMCRRISFDSAKPDSIGGVDVHQGAENIAISCGKVSHQFLRIQRTGSVNQSAAGPSGVVQMVSEYVRYHCHKYARVYI